MRGEVARWGAVLGCAAAAGAAAAALAGAARRWDGATARAVARLHDPVLAAHAGQGRLEHHDPALLLAAPAPVRRYFAFALGPGQRTVYGARLQHVGEFAARPGRWKPFTSVQHVTAAPPGFLWDARLSMSPLPVAVRVRDGYVGGVGSTRAALGALVPVGSQQGTPEVAASALWRYLAEAAWLPTVLLPSERLAWTPVDDTTSRATLRDQDVTAVADFHFGARGEVVRVTGMRYRAVGDGQVLTPTEGRHGAYERVDGMMIPTEGEVAWLLPEGPHVYWRARLVRASYQYADHP